MHTLQCLRAHTATWIITGILPLPILVATDPASSADVSCVYLSLGCAWLGTEIYGDGGFPESPRDWAVKMLAIFIAVAANLMLFILFGLAGAVRTNIPLPLMASLSVIPAIGLIPWLIRRVRRPHMAIVLGCMIVLASKLAACVIARIVYGPDYIAQGYVSGDWRTAKLMISLFWIFSSSVSLVFLLTEWRVARRRDSSLLLGPQEAGAPL